MVATGQKCHAGFPGQMGLRLRDFTRQKGVCTGSDCRLEVALCTAAAPSNATQGSAIAGQHQYVALGHRLGLLGQGLQGGEGAGFTHETQGLFAKAAVSAQAQGSAPLGIVAPLGMRIQGQVIGKEIEVMRHQASHTRFEPARQAAVLPAPKQPMMHQHRIRLGRHSGFNQTQAGSHP